MTVKITIIGLGQIGTSLGLALAKHKDTVTTLGHDKSPETARSAHKLGVVASVSNNLSAAVKEAQVIVLAIPFDEMHETLKMIAPDLREDAVVMDTAPVKSVVAAWAKELLPAKTHYVGLSPALNPLCLEDAGVQQGAARDDLFHKGVIAISAPHETDEGALKLAADLITLLGAQPLFADLAEMDGVMALVHLLPGLSAAALAETTTGQPGWYDTQKFAGKPFSASTRPLAGDGPAALAEAALQDRANTVRVLDEYIATLVSLRKDIAEENKAGLSERLDYARQGRTQWQSDRLNATWRSGGAARQDLPKYGDLLSRQLGGLGKLFGRGDKKPGAD